MQLLTSTQGHIVHIWDTVKWRSQCWEFDSSCDTAAWSANGSMLLIGTSESFISSLDFSKKASTLSTNFPIDVSGTDAVGGIVDMLAWSPTNERLAVSFRGHHMGSELIALFATRLGVVLSSQVVGFIRGPPSTSPSLNKPIFMQFCPTFSKGALLAVCWSDGVITCYPMYFQHNLNTE